MRPEGASTVRLASGGKESPAHVIASTPSPLPSIPDHQLLRCIGRGSYGEVWLARNMMGRFRAVKIVSRRSFQDQRPFERELAGIQKFEPISRSHEGFIDILHVGINEAEGYFYYVMELGDDETSGQSIDPDRYIPQSLARELAARGKLFLPQCLQLGLGLSNALAELHRQGLVHRDIKPSNIIFVNGVAKLADIGLVAGVDETRSYVGTEGFIPPEGPGTPQADIYSLGKVLYEISTGKDRQDFPELPTRLEELPDQEGFLELNEVILQACQNDPARRYKSAQQMHADLQVLANGESVKRLRLLERRLARLKRMAGVSMLVLAVAALVFFQIYREWKVALESRQRQVGANVAYGTRALEGGDLLGALPYFAAALDQDRGNPDREELHRFRFASVQAQCPKVLQMWFCPKEARRARFSPDGQQVMIAQWNERDEPLGNIQVFDPQTGRARSPLFESAYGLREVTLSPDGHLILTASENNTASVWRVPEGTNVLRLQHPDKVFSVAFSPDGRQILTGAKDNRARLWDARTGSLLQTLEGHTDAILAVGFSPDGRRLVTAGRDGTARLWDVRDNRPLGPPLPHSTWVCFASFNQDGSRLLTGCFDHKAHVWETASGREIFPTLNHGDGVVSAQFSPDGRLIVTACLDHTVRLWDAVTQLPLKVNSILRHTDRVNYAEFAPDGHRLLTACTDGTVRLWDFAGARVASLPRYANFSADKRRYLSVRTTEMKVHDSLSRQAPRPGIRTRIPVETARLSADGRFVVTTSDCRPGTNRLGRLVEIWDASTGRPAGPSFATGEGLTNLVLSADGRCLLAFGGKVAQVWDVAVGKPLLPSIVHSEKVGGAAFNSRGEQVATWSDSQVQVRHRVNGREVFAPLNHPFPVRYVAFSPDGSRLVTCGAEDGFIPCYAQLWDAQTGRPVAAPLRHADGVLYAAFSPDGRHLITGSEDFTAMVWDAATSQQLTPALKHDHQVLGAAFSPDGKWVVTASLDHTARIWSAETGDPLSPPLYHLQYLTEASFLGDNRHLAVTDLGGGTWLWQLPLDKRPVEVLSRLAHLLSGGAVTPSGRLSPMGTESLEALWQGLKTTYPADFATSAEEITAWYEFAARESEVSRQWRAAAFHLKQLLALQPNAPQLAARLAHAQEQLH